MGRDTAIKSSPPTALVDHEDRACCTTQVSSQGSEASFYFLDLGVGFYPPAHFASLCRLFPIPAPLELHAVWQPHRAGIPYQVCWSDPRIVAFSTEKAVGAGTSAMQGESIYVWCWPGSDLAVPERPLERAGWKIRAGKKETIRESNPRPERRRGLGRPFRTHVPLGYFGQEGPGLKGCAPPPASPDHSPGRPPRPRPRNPVGPALKHALGSHWPVRFRGLFRAVFSNKPLSLGGPWAKCVGFLWSGRGRGAGLRLGVGLARNILDTKSNFFCVGIALGGVILGKKLHFV